MSEVRLPAPVKATNVKDIEGAQAGAFEFFINYGEPQEAEPKGIIYVCPCGCGCIGSLPFRLQGVERPSWIWDGNREAPTLSLSVHYVGHWHGFLRAGMWTQA